MICPTTAGRPPLWHRLTSMVAPLGSSPTSVSPVGNNTAINTSPLQSRHHPHYDGQALPMTKEHHQRTTSANYTQPVWPPTPRPSCPPPLGRPRGAKADFSPRRSFGLSRRSPATIATLPRASYSNKDGALTHHAYGRRHEDLGLQRRAGTPPPAAALGPNPLRPQLKGPTSQPVTRQSPP